MGIQTEAAQLMDELKNGLVQEPVPTSSVGADSVEGVDSVVLADTSVVLLADAQDHGGDETYFSPRADVGGESEDIHPV